jgi:hypothetical protein
VPKVIAGRTASLETRDGSGGGPTVGATESLEEIRGAEGRFNLGGGSRARRDGMIESCSDARPETAGVDEPGNDSGALGGGAPCRSIA